MPSGRTLLNLAGFLLAALLVAASLAVGPFAWAQQLRQTSAFLSRDPIESLPLTASKPLQPHLRIQWHDRKLTVSAERVPLVTVLRGIIRRTGLEVQGLERVNGDVSAEFTGVDLKEALENLLSHTDYVLEGFTGPNGSARVRVLILEQRGSASGQGLTSQRAGAAQPEPPAVSPDQAAVMRARQSNIQGLRKAMLDSDPVVRAAALQALSQEDPDVVAAVMADLPESSKAGIGKLQALQQLVQNAPPDKPVAVSSLADALKDKDPAVRAFAVQNLAERGGSEAMGYLHGAFQGLDPANRMLIIESVVQKDGAEQILQDALQDPDESIRSTASELVKQFDASKDENDADVK